MNDKDAKKMLMSIKLSVIFARIGIKFPRCIEFYKRMFQKEETWIK